MKTASIGDITKSTSSYTVNHVHDCKVPFISPIAELHVHILIYLTKLKATLDNNNYTNTNSKFLPFVMYVCMCNNCYTFFQYPTYEIFNKECLELIGQLKMHKIVNV